MGRPLLVQAANRRRASAGGRSMARDYRPR
jgi:hypothetical protein